MREQGEDEGGAAGVEEGDDGTWFLACRGEKKERCEFFKWALSDLAPQFGGLLSPLT